MYIYNFKVGALNMLSLHYVYIARNASAQKQQQTDDSLIEENEYHMLEPFLEHEGSADSGVGASGSGDGEFTDVKRYAKEPIPSTKTIKGK